VIAAVMPVGESGRVVCLADMALEEYFAAGSEL
jgi:hypothetical protein